jgi:integrase/recombinase XerD
MHNPENERIKRAYFIYLKEARRLGEHSIDTAAAALARFEEYTKYRDFKKFHIQQAIGFKTQLSELVSPRTGQLLSRATVFSTLSALRAFFQWLSTQPGYRSHLTSADAEYFALSDKEARIAKVIADRPVPTVDQIGQVLETMPSSTDIEQRNRAVVAFTLLTGARDGAVASLKRKHVDIVEGKIVQDAREVRTKFSKTFTTWFFPVGEDVRQIVVDWVQYLDTLQLFGPSDPLFPATVVVQDQYHLFQTGGLSRRHWSNATPIRTIFKEAFTGAGLAYANPHSFRKTLAQLGERLCRTPEEFKAWSQNLGHEQVLTTFSSYGQVGLDRQAELIRHLADRRETGTPKLEAIDRMIRSLQEGRHALE